MATIMLACPFCGSSPSLVHRPLFGVLPGTGYPGEYEICVQCSNENCSLTLPFGKYYTMYMPIEKAKQCAIADWNLRDGKELKQGDE